jgi:small subunit ribosomal protein S8
MWSDPIADMLTRVRNAVGLQRREVKVPWSKIKAAVARVLRDEGYISGFDVIDVGERKILRIQLKYGPRGEQVIHEIRRESKAGSRLYRPVGELPRVLDGMGICVVSTNRGVLSDRGCREQNVGGELLCTVY